MGLALSVLGAVVDENRLPMKEVLNGGTEREGDKDMGGNEAKQNMTTGVDDGLLSWV